MRLPVFKGLSPRALRDVAQLMERRSYKLGSFIFRQGDEADCLYVLTTGSVRIVRQMTVPRAFAARHSTVPAFHQSPTLHPPPLPFPRDSFSEFFSVQDVCMKLD
jgi:hypothetical protein